MKKNIRMLLFVCFLLLLILFSTSNLVAAKKGLSLWANCVVPSLFPFFIATELLNYTDTAHIVGKLFNKIMRPLFNVPGEGAYALVLGIVSGYPVGAKIVVDLYENNICTREEAERLLAFTNNSGPLFIVGTIGVLLFGNSTIGLLLLITHILACITIGIFLGIKSKLLHSASLDLEIHSCTTQQKTISNNEATDLGSILSASITKAIHTTLQIGGFVVLFSVILSILNNIASFDIVEKTFVIFNIPCNYTKGVLCGMIELTNGLNIIATTPSKLLSINIILCAFLLGFGGISILLQVISITSKSKLSVKTYILGKLLQGIVASLYTAIFILAIPSFQFDIF